MDQTAQHMKNQEDTKKQRENDRLARPTTQTSFDRLVQSNLFRAWQIGILCSWSLFGHDAARFSKLSAIPLPR